MRDRTGPVKLCMGGCGRFVETDENGKIYRHFLAYGHHEVCSGSELDRTFVHANVREEEITEVIIRPGQVRLNLVVVESRDFVAVYVDNVMGQCYNYYKRTSAEAFTGEYVKDMLRAKGHFARLDTDVESYGWERL